MRKEDFKEMTIHHCVTCDDIIKACGICAEIACSNCPFDYKNATNSEHCFSNGYVSKNSEYEKDEKAVESAKEFIELFKTPNTILLETAPDKMVATEEVEDMVNSPKHYKIPGTDVEVIDVIKGCLTKEQYEGFLKANVIKYVLRENKKNRLQDLEKAYKYLGWLIESKKMLK